MSDEREHGFLENPAVWFLGGTLFAAVVQVVAYYVRGGKGARSEP